MRWASLEQCALACPSTLLNKPKYRYFLSSSVDAGNVVQEVVDEYYVVYRNLAQSFVPALLVLVIGVITSRANGGCSPELEKA